MGWFEKEAGAEEGSEAFGLSETEQLQRKIFISTFAMIAKMASADGAVKKEEVEAVDRFMKSVLKLDSERRVFAIKVFNRARNSKSTFKDYAEEYKNLLKDKPEMYEWMVDALARLSLADKIFSEGEAEILSTACEIFGINEERYAKLRGRIEAKVGPSADVQQALSELGCTEDSSKEEIEANFTKLAEEYDPARVLELGLPEEFVALAEKRYEVITKAYSVLKKSGS